MVRDLGRAPSGLPPSQGGQPDRRERDKTHSTSASDLRTTPSTAGGGRPPPHPRKSSGSGAGASGSMSTPTPSIPAAPATVVRGSRRGPSGEGPSGPTIPPIDVNDIFEEGADTTTLTRGQMRDLIGRIFDVKLQQFASEMGLGDRRPQPVTLVELELDDYGVPEGDSLRVLGTMVREVCRLYLPDDAIWSAVPVNQRYQILDIATRLAAKYGSISVRHKNAKARVESRREKNIMVTNPYGHQGFGGFRARFKKKFGVYPEPKHNAFLRLHGMKRVFEFMRTGREFPEVGGPSNAEDDEQDDGADGAAAGSDVGANDDGAESSELEGSGNEFEEDDQGQAPQQERVEELEDAEDDEEDEDSSCFEIREALREPVEPALTEAQHIIRFVTRVESSAPRTLPQSAVLQAIPLGPPSGVLRAIPRDP
ncbi:hypothetical protein R1sor_001859 [Riccia sorocarpa]|uniref:Uncharacterized protein n=1 Tax=Riccia sorocarpa TaxID=122646 RepID=A0ABD3GX40_9MARC